MSGAAGGPAVPARRIPRRPQWTTVALLAALAVQLIPLVVFPTVLSQDGPAHVDGAWVLLHHGNDDTVGAALREQYRIDLTPVPNMLTTLVLAALLTVLGADAAERLFMAGFVIALVAALGYALRGLDRGAGWLAVAALPFAGSHLVAFGFYNFCWGIVAALCVIGLAVRRRGGWSIRGAAALALLLLMTWATHLLPYALAVGAVAAFGVARTVAERREGASWRAALRRHVVPVVAAAIPSGVLTVTYVLSGHAPVGAPAGEPSLDRVTSLLTGVRPFVASGSVEKPAAVLTAAGLLVLGVSALRSPRRDPAAPGPRAAERWALGALLVVATLAYCVTPAKLGNGFGFLVDRVAWFPGLLLVLWGVTGRPGPRVRGVVVALFLVGVCTAAVVRLPAQHARSAQVAGLLSVSDRIPPGSTFLVLRYDDFTPGGIPDPLLHASSRLAVHVAGVDVGHYEAVTPYFQVSFAGGPDLRRRLDPTLNGLERTPPVIDLAAVRGQLDYVLVVGLERAPERVRTAAATREVLSELSAHYHRAVIANRTEPVDLWRADRR